MTPNPPDGYEVRIYSPELTAWIAVLTPSRSTALGLANTWADSNVPFFTSVTITSEIARFRFGAPSIDILRLVRE